MAILKLWKLSVVVIYIELTWRVFINIVASRVRHLYKELPNLYEKTLNILILDYGGSISKLPVFPFGTVSLYYCCVK